MYAIRSYYVLSSVVAVNADTGEYVWHYQTVDHDSWDYNATMNIVLADLNIGGKEREALLIAPVITSYSIHYTKLYDCLLALATHGLALMQPSSRLLTVGCQAYAGRTFSIRAASFL